MIRTPVAPTRLRPSLAATSEEHRRACCFFGRQTLGLHGDPTTARDRVSIGCSTLTMVGPSSPGLPNTRTARDEK